MFRPVIDRIAYRVYQNFLMHSRLEEYRRLLNNLVEQKYVFLTISELAACVKKGAMPELSCVLRMDVDSDLATTRRMFEIAQEAGVRATYYFRLSTLDRDLMRRISAQGSEVGYHYEELASVAKSLGLRDRTEIDARIPQIQEKFARNVAKFAEHAGSLPRTIASHGDWINRKLQITNIYAIDHALRERFGLVAEAYDTWLNAPVKARVSDTDAPVWWTPVAPSEAIAQRVSCVQILVHPRQWQANAFENLRLDALRAAEILLYTGRQGFISLRRRDPALGVSRTE